MKGSTLSELLAQYDLSVLTIPYSAATAVMFYRKSAVEYPFGHKRRTDDAGHLAGIVIAICVLIAGCGASPDEPETKPTDPKVGEKGGEKLRRYPNGEFPPSLVQLLAHPDRYHGEYVQVMEDQIMTAPFERETSARTFSSSPDSFKNRCYTFLVPRPD